ncbi:MAG TPA: class I SAM-dependent methyltransferase [Solirubrobacteraceae bacterium]
MSGCWICEAPVKPCALFVPEPFLECERCGFIFRPDLDDAALKRVYAEGDYEDMRGEQYLTELAHRRRDARVRLAYIQPWAAGGRLLDVGAAGGAFVAEAAVRGFHASGIEPVPSFARAAREQLAVDVRDGAVEDLDLRPDSYEVITLWHVLEHLPSPLNHLRRLSSALTARGTLAIEVPNAGSAVAAYMGSAWPSLEPAVHVSQFTPASLRGLFERAGLEICDLRTTTITPYLPLRARFGPGHLAARAKAAYWLRDARGEHPQGHELLRVVAQRR